MPRSRGSVLLALGLALLISSVIFGAATAQAATDTITVVSAGSPATSVGDLSVVVDSTTPLTALTVHLLNGTTDVMDPPMTATDANAPITGGYQSTYTVTTPIPEGTLPAGLPLGDYGITVDAADAGTSVTGANAGTLAFVDELTFTVAADHTQVSYDNKVVTLSGSVTSLSPDGTTTPFAGSTVTMVSSFKSDVPVPTDGSGDFSIQVTPHGGDWVFFESGLNSTANGQSPTVNFTVQMDPVRVTASLSAKTVTYGGKVTATGTVTYEPGTTYVPLAGNTVAIYETQNPYSPVMSATTDSNGHFSVTLPGVAGDTTWKFEAGGVPGDPYLDQAVASLPMAVNLPVTITGLHVTLSQYWKLSVSGCLGLARKIPGSFVRNGGLVIQYGETPRGPWRTLIRGFQWGNGCGNAGVRFSTSATAAVNYAYYRAYVPALKSDGGTDPGYTAGASGSVLVWKYADRIVNFSVSARVVGAGGRLTVKGRLQYYFSGWHAYRNQTVFIVFRPKGSSQWYWIVKPKTNSAGWFSGTFADPLSATWSALFEGNSTHLAASPPGIYIRVRGTAGPSAALYRPLPFMR